MSKKVDHSEINTQKIKEYCKKHGLKYAWKNQSQGHMIVQSEEFEAYVWVQRMRTVVRMRNGVPLSKPEPYSLESSIFNGTVFSKMVGLKRKNKSKHKPLIPHVEHGITVVRIPQKATVDERTKAMTWAHNIAMKISRSHERDYYYGN